MKRIVATMYCGVMVGMWPVIASAQSNTGRTAQLEEIVVTAQKREEKLQSVPISVAAVSGAALAASGVRSSDDLQIAVPGLNIQHQAVASLVFIRGVGNGAGQPGNENAVATFVDGVYMPDQEGTTMTLQNLERIEVLKGPQGTLFGRNATGGAINVITKTPSFAPSLEAIASFGNHNTLEGRFYGTTGISDHVAADLALYYHNQEDGSGRNTTTGNDTNRAKNFSVRSKIVMDVSPDTKVTVAGDYSYDLSVFGLRAIDSSHLVDGSIGYAGRWFDISTNLDGYSKGRRGGGSIILEHDFGQVKLTSISAYRNLTLDQIIDVDGTAVPLVDAYLYQNTNQYTQELRLAGESDRLTWVAGGFYLSGYSSLKPFYIAGLAASPLARLVNFNKQSLKSLAGFAQATYEIWPGTRLTAGLRYTTDKRKLHGEQYGDLAGGGRIPVPFASGQNIVNTGRRFSNLSWRLAVDHKIDENVMAYLSYNRGFKSGTYNMTADSSLPPVAPERLDAIEAGLKTTILDNRLRLNSAAYYYLYNNLQVSILVGPSQTLVNAAKAKIYGLDADFEAIITDTLSLSGGGGWVHGRYSNFPNAPYFAPNTPPVPGNSASTRSAKGNNVVFTPEFSGSLAANYRIPVGSGEIKTNVSYYYNGGFYYAADNRTRQAAYSIVNGQIAWVAPDEAYTIRLWANNLFDQHHYVTLLELAVGDTATVAQGRTFGISAGVKF